MASENFAGIDFDEIKEATALEVDEIKVLKLCFNLFDVKKQDFLGSDDLVSRNLKESWLISIDTVININLALSVKCTISQTRGSLKRPFKGKIFVSNDFYSSAPLNMTNRGHMLGLYTFAPIGGKLFRCRLRVEPFKCPL